MVCHISVCISQAGAISSFASCFIVYASCIMQLLCFIKVCCFIVYASCIMDLLCFIEVCYGIGVMFDQNTSLKVLLFV
jgi:hypothetical protein